MENRLIETGTQFGSTSCVPQSRSDGFTFISPCRRTRANIDAEIKLIRELLQLVNTKEEYELLERDIADLEGLSLLVSSSSLKGGAALICR